ncbi:hypothetical protein ACFOU2_08310 [Bacillus songklensis]|uniref:Malate dehydrogenase n=1 Tax=Bacillus songklensis TaxID=1069116 RepID=A0ABV8B1T1_9BACI
MNKISIIGGAGTLGATMGFLLSLDQKIEEVCLEVLKFLFSAAFLLMAKH